VKKAWRKGWRVGEIETGTLNFLTFDCGFCGCSYWMLMQQKSRGRGGETQKYKCPLFLLGMLPFLWQPSRAPSSQLPAPTTRLWCRGICCLKSPLRFCLCRSRSSSLHLLFKSFLLCTLHSAIRTPVPVPLFIYFICLISFHFVSFHLVSCLTYAVSVRKDWLDFFAYSFPSFVLKDQPKQQSASNFGHRNSPKRPRNFRH